MKYLFAAAFFLLSLSQCMILAQSPANTMASPRTGMVLNYLAGLGDDCDILYSQDLGHGWFISQNYQHYIQDLATETGVTLPMVGGDPGLGEFDLSTMNASFDLHWNQQGLVTLSWHLDNPWTGGDTWDTSNQGELNELLDEQAAVHQVWMTQLDAIADVLLDLQARDIVVIWRPLHEANGTWFWWGHSFNANPAESAPYIALWQHMFDYFSQDKGLDNLLWVYSAGENWDNPVDFCYPGEDYVDLVGIDLYHDDLSQVATSNFDDLIALDKPFAITEYGPTIPNAGSYDYSVVHQFIKDNYPEVTYLHAWHNWTGHNNTFIDNSNASPVLNDICHQSVDPAIFGPLGSCASDLNDDGLVDIDDFLILNSAFGSPCTSCAADINGSGTVDVNDFLIFNSEYGFSCD